MFEKRLLAFGDRVERVLVRLVIGLSLTVLLVQAALARPELHRWLSFVDRLEGVSLSTENAPFPAAQPATSPAAVSPSGPSLTLTLRGLPSAPWVTVLVNGDAKGNFLTGSLTFPVNGGDLVEIDPGRSEAAITLKVTEARGVSFPSAGQTLTVQKSIARLGRVLSATGR